MLILDFNSYSVFGWARFITDTALRNKEVK